VRRWSAWLFGGVALLLVGTIPVPRAKAESQQLTGPAQDMAVLRNRIASIIERGHVPGAGIAIVTRDGLVWSDGVGLADVAQARAVDANTPFRLGSVTKNVTALAVMQQVEHGRLSLETRLHEVAPEVPVDNRWENSHPITIANLLEHTAGFDLYRFNDDVDYGPSPRPLLDALRVNPAARESRWPPGTRASYSNEGYTAAGYVLEQVTGQSFDDLVRNEIFAPLGMDSSAFRLTPELNSRLAVGYGDDGLEQVYLEDMNRPAANLIASANDMAHYLQFWLGRGEVDGQHLLSPAGVQRMQARMTLPYAGPAEQYGLGTDTAQYHGYLAHGHTGIQLGFLASLRYFPDDGFGWVVMLNARSSQVQNDIEAELLAYLTGGSESTPPLVGAQGGRLADLAGEYRDAAPTQEIFAALADVFGGTEIQVRQDGLWERTRDVGGLRSLVAQPPFRKLIAVGNDGSFRHEDETVSSRFFTQTDDGRQVLITQLGYFEKTPTWLAAAKRVLILGALALVSSSLVLLPLAIGQLLLPLPFTAAGGPLRIPALAALMPPILLAVIPPVTWLALSRASEPFAVVNLTTISLLVLSCAFPLLTLLTVAVAGRTLIDPAGGVFVRGYLLLVALAGAVLVVFAWSAHWIGLRTWSW
jgi:CubicO group peptidase (beta-lactamase class C family)